MKRCSHCHREKPVTEFHRNRSTRDGYNDWCKDCRREYGHPSRKPGDNRAQALAYAAANKRLRDAHPEEFRRYYDEERS